MNKVSLKNQDTNPQLLYPSQRFAAALVGIIALLSGLAVFFLFPTDASAAVIRRAPNNLGLVGYWSFDDARGSTATDFSGNGNAGTLTNMNPGSDWVAGKKGGALDFDGGDDYLKAPKSANYSFQETDSFAVSVWFNTEDISTRQQVLKKDGEAGSFIYSMQMGDDSFPQQLRFSLANEDNAFGALVGGDISSNKWHHAVLVYDGSSLEGFIDGESVGSDTWSEGDINAGSNELFIGQKESGVSNPVNFQGKIDEVRIYDRALSASEVKDLYNAGGFARRNATNDALFEDRLVSHWSMDGSDISGSTVKDEHGANDGTKEGDPIARPGRLGQSLDFDGNGDYINVGKPSSLKFTGSDNFSVCGWGYVTEKDGSYQDFGRIFSADNGGGNAEGYRLFYHKDDEKWNFQFSDGDDVELSGGSVVENQWTFVCGVYDTNNVYIYEDGNLTNSASVSVNSPDYSLAGDFAVGGRLNDDKNWFKGRIDDVRIYDAALSEDEISRLHTATKPDTINSSQSEKLTDGLVGMWSFDGQDLSGTTAEDVSGNGNDGTLNGDLQPAIGRIGQALEFDGGDDYVDVGGMLDGAAEVTMSAWVYLDSGTNNQDVVVGKSSDAKDYNNIAYLYRHQASQDLDIRVETNDVRAAISNEIPENEWKHLTTAFSGSNYLRFYIDGKKVGEVTSGVPSVFPTTDYVRIGDLHPPAGSSFKLDGKVDNVRIYDRALSESEIERLYRIGQ